MNNKKSVGINAVLNVIKSSLSILFPLVTYPYIFRILHKNGVGRYEYAYSIISYFSYIATLGVTQYAVREGAKIRDNKNDFNRFANEIFTINVISTIVSYVLLLFTIVAIPKLNSYSWIILICSIIILFNTLGVDWINSVYEDFKFITIRSVITHFFSLILIFALVKDSNDLYLYAFITTSNYIIVGISNWIYCRKYVKLKIIISNNLKKHLKPVMVFFINTIATNIYVNSDVTLLGWMINDSCVGLYSLAVRIYSVIKNVLASIYIVTVPRISYYFGNKEYSKLKSIYTILCSSITLILLPTCSGIISVAPEIIMIVGGKEYNDSVMALRILGLSLIGAIFGGLLTYCLNIPIGKEKITFKATILSASINIVLNIILIPFLKQNGTALTTAISEFSVVFYCIFMNKADLKRFLNLKLYFSQIWQALVEVVVIIVVSIIVHSILGISILSMLIIMIISIVIYCVILLLSKNELLMILLKRKRSD